MLVGNPSASGMAGKFQVVETGQNQPAIVAGDTAANSIWLVPNLSGGGYNPLAQNGDAGIIFRNQNQNAANAGLVIAPHNSLNVGLRIAPDGNVGVGNGLPQYKLDVAGIVNATEYRLNGSLLAQWQNGTGNDIYYDAGNVGIGTSTPIAPLHVAGPGNVHIDISTTDPSFNSYMRLMAITSNNRNEAQIQYVGRFSFVEPLSGTVRMTIDENGTVHCKKLRVSTTWSDFVFDENYQRMSYDEKRNFYKINKHLPNVPSAKEIETDGLDIGNVMKGIMQNVEEDRLDITELFIRMEKLEKQNEELKKEIIDLKNHK
jgi:hypothetical protein